MNEKGEIPKTIFKVNKKPGIRALSHFMELTRDYHSCPVGAGTSRPSVVEGWFIGERVA